MLVNAPDQVWLDRGLGLERAPVRFDSDAAVRRLATRLAAQAGRRLDDAAPFVDAVLPDGTRLHAILPPLVAHPTLSLRVLARRSLALAELVALGAMSGELAELLTALVQARLTLLISGGTGTGKTTLLAALLATVSPTERIITIEDTAELAVRHQHVVALLARSANVEGAGAVELRELVRQALRMRADRLVVGEFRGAEIVELLAALNTGHAGGAATVHANSVSDVPARLVALAALGGMPASALAAQAASALDVLVHVRRDRDGRRRVEQLALWPAGPVLAEAGAGLDPVGGPGSGGRAVAGAAGGCRRRGAGLLAEAAVPGLTLALLGAALLLLPAPAPAGARLGWLAARGRPAGAGRRAGAVARRGCGWPAGAGCCAPSGTPNGAGPSWPRPSPCCATSTPPGRPSRRRSAPPRTCRDGSEPRCWRCGGAGPRRPRGRSGAGRRAAAGIPGRRLRPGRPQRGAAGPGRWPACRPSWPPTSGPRAPCGPPWPVRAARRCCWPACRCSAWRWAARWARRRSGCCCIPAPAGSRWPSGWRSNWPAWRGRWR